MSSSLHIFLVGARGEGKKGVELNELKTEDLTPTLQTATLKG